MKRILQIFAITNVAILMLLACSGCTSSPPTIQSGEFPFVFEYEYQGQTYIIEDTVICSYGGINPDSGIPTRWYASELKNSSDLCILTFDANVESFLVEGQINEASYVSLDCGYGGYYLGDYLYKDRGPCFYYVETLVSSTGVRSIRKNQLTATDVAELFDIKIIRFEFCEPIRNSLE